MQSLMITPILIFILFLSTVTFQLTLTNPTIGAIQRCSLFVAKLFVGFRVLAFQKKKKKSIDESYALLITLE